MREYVATGLSLQVGRVVFVTPIDGFDGRFDGLLVGFVLGFVVGPLVGLADGCTDGFFVGFVVGRFEGLANGFKDGFFVGRFDGFLLVGLDVGLAVGRATSGLWRSSVALRENRSLVSCSTSRSFAACVGFAVGREEGFLDG